MSIEVIPGDIFDSDSYILLHQCNCVTQKSLHFAKDVFDRYPFADVYNNRKEKSIPGTIAVRKDPNGKKIIIALFAQRYPGISKWTNDTYYSREEWIKKCLNEVAKLPNLDLGVSIPKGMGCGAAGGNWDSYLKIIKEFAESSGAKVLIYDRDLSRENDHDDKPIYVPEDLKKESATNLTMKRAKKRKCDESDNEENKKIKKDILSFFSAGS